MLRYLLRAAVAGALLVILCCGVDHFTRPGESHRELNADGSVFCEGPVDDEGKYHGDLRFYHPDGRVKTVFKMYHGAMDGVLFHDDDTD